MLHVSTASTQHVLILCHEIWGITPALRAKAATWRQHGFHVVVPSFYETVGLPAHAPDEAAAFRARAALSRSSITATLTAAITPPGGLPGPPPCTSVLGYSMGGSIALWAATTDLPLAASVTFYGGGLEVSPWPDLAPGVELLDELRVPWLGLYGGRDPLTPPAALARVMECRRVGEPTVEVHVYPELEHAFALDATDARHSASATEECERLTVEHLRSAELLHNEKHLGPTRSSATRQV
ncbi:carboxymethylenebutenolidase [Quadrisphaera granulorum]|uniref:Carboxymethylenebutenolidase n=1 Tax=Quadrisphaera granulorum TaxID=317664 RepID=A0A315ZQN8_9ACTN|nr:dienelactone hydrolase family protein [Quadrisphaera granulorum]PWJ47619.1 carboxymethylenebutenolidase [Quadrisphaera granulorum]SZE98749.1 carboxymethylenebutenolidase [Quadrisphaera granulorum]